MQTEIEQKINDPLNGNEIKLTGKIKLNINQSGIFTVGRLCVKGIIQIKRPNVIIDGSNAEIEVDVEDSTTSDWSLFFLHPRARNVELKNLKIRVRIKNPVHSTRLFAFIYNTAYALKLENCHLELYSEKQLNLVGIYNNGNLDTHMETRADSLVVENSFLKVECRASEFVEKCNIYGIYNYLANSISIQNTYIYSTNKGDGPNQQAVGIYTNGRFGRFIGNNIKANGSHNVGQEKEQAYAFGFINEGLYSIINANNIVGEWAGMCVGLENKGEYSIISSNKILSTHTICGRSLRSYANNCNIECNILTSTSRNARLIEHLAENCIIGHNIMEILMVKSACNSGCGIYAIGERCIGNIISENIIRNVLDCAIFADEKSAFIHNNQVSSYRETIACAGSENQYLLLKLSEKNVHSINKERRE